MFHGKPQLFTGLVIAELQGGLFHLEPVEIVLHVLRGDAPECSVKPFHFNEPWKIDILDFLNKNYMYEFTMEDLAHYTGRSLATFKRDFKKISDLTPEKWLIRKLLEVAYNWKQGCGCLYQSGIQKSVAFLGSVQKAVRHCADGGGGHCIVIYG